MRRLLMCASALALLFAGSATAQTVTERGGRDAWYLGVASGASWAENNGLDGVASGSFDENDADVLGLVSIGRGFREGWRTEIEGGWRKTDFGPLSDTPGSSDAEARQWTAMVNVIRDLAPVAQFRPYIGAGVGAAWTKLDFTTPTLEVDDTDTNLAAQAMVGAVVQMSPRVALDVGYRYFWTDQPDYDLVEFRNDFDRHEAVVGLRFAFGALPQPRATRDTTVVIVQQPPEQTVVPPPVIVTPPPPPPPPPPPQPNCPTTETQVFFGFDSATVDPQSRSVIQNEVMQLNEQCDRTFVVVGHTDSAGSVEYNERLAMRRARAVQNALISMGVPASEIRLESAGQRDLAVPTGDGVREPRNRRVVVRVERRPRPGATTTMQRQDPAIVPGLPSNVPGQAATQQPGTIGGQSVSPAQPGFQQTPSSDPFRATAPPTNPQPPPFRPDTLQPGEDELGTDEGASTSTQPGPQ